MAFDYSYPVLTKLWQAFQREMSIDGFPPFTTPISLCPSTDTRSSIQSETFRRTHASLYLRFRRRTNTSFKLHPLETCVNSTSRYLSTMRRLSIMKNGRRASFIAPFYRLLVTALVNNKNFYDARDDVICEMDRTKG